ncbi:MAG: hypothetical protein IPJ41_06275 [Phycisphaerales bacterium]|nr:hypothetical protein [Phycisphaerales bacterium]
MVTGHIFEGGHSLYTPLPGTTGFTRLFAREHGAYRPEGELAKALLAGTIETTGGLGPQETTR